MSCKNKNKTIIKLKMKSCHTALFSWFIDRDDLLLLLTYTNPKAVHPKGPINVGWKIFNASHSSLPFPFKALVIISSTFFCFRRLRSRNICLEKYGGLSIFSVPPCYSKTFMLVFSFIFISHSSYAIILTLPLLWKFSLIKLNSQV